MKKYVGILFALVLMFGGVITANAADEDQFGTGTTGTADTGVSSSGECDENCPLTSEANTENPQTGSFLPYVIVIGGIAFSVLAISLAKKNTKLYQV